jgi:hypothetical protein
VNISFFAKRNRWSGAFAIVILFLGSIFPFFSYAQQKTTVSQGTATGYGGGSIIYNANGTVNSTSNTTAGGLTTTTTYGQAAGYNQTTQSNASASNTAPGAIGSCVGSIAAGYVSKYVSSLIQSVADALHVNTISGTNSKNGTANPNGVLAPGWDAIGYCIGNGLLTYITNSVVAWINTGFNGSPAFISNPQQYFKGIADIEAGTFINTLAKDTTGLNICQPFNINVGTSILNGYAPQNPLTCSLEQLKANLSNPNNYHVTVSGAGGYSNFNNQQSLNTFYGISQNPQNNAYGAYLGAQQQLAATIAQQQNTANINLTWGNGFQSVQNCPPSQTTQTNAGTTTTKQPCNTTTPGNVIASQLDDTLHLGNERVVLANSFDQVINALVGTLIKLALNKVLTQS